MSQPKYVIACRVASYGEYEADAYAHLAALGVRHVEIPVPPPSAIDRTADELERAGLAASTLHGECNITRADIEQQIAVQMPAFRALGCNTMFASVKAGDTPLETACSRLWKAGNIAAQHGVTIVLETHPDLATNAEVMLTTMRGVNHPHVRINFDTANLYFYNENLNCLDELRQVLPYVAAVHLKDTDGGYRHWHFPALGEGIVDFAGVFELLDSTGFTGPCTLEIEGIEGEQKSEELVRGRIAASLDHLCKLGRF